MFNIYQQMQSDTCRNTILLSIAGLLFGILIITVPPLYLLALAALALLLFWSTSRPEWGILTVVVLISTVIPEDKLPMVPVGIGSIHLTDIIILSMAAKILFDQVMGYGRFVKTPLNVPLMLFVLMVLIAACTSIVVYGKDFNITLRLLRTVSYYVIFFLITNHVTSLNQIRFLIRALLVLASLVAVAMIIQASVGPSIELLPGRVEMAWTLGREFDALRILPPGQVLLYIMFVTALCLCVFNFKVPLLTSVHFYASLLLGAALALTYTRSYWVAIVLSTCILALIASSSARRRLLLFLSSICVMTMLTVGVLKVAAPNVDETLSAITDRVMSLFAGKELTQNDSLDARYTENRYALQVVASHPVTGIGLGNDYRDQLFGPDDVLTHYVHNSYLFVATDTGLVGLSLLMWFYVGFIVRCVKHWKRIRDAELRSVLVGFMLCGIGMVPMAFFVPVFMEWHSIVMIATMAGLSEAIIRYQTAHAATEVSP